MEKAFSASNQNFWFSLLVFAFSVAAMLGIHFPQSAADTATGLTSAVKSGNLFAVIGLLTTSVLGPVVAFIRKKPNIPASAIIGSSNFWVYLGGFLVSIAMLVGIGIPADAPQQIVNAIEAKQWGALATLAFTAIANPIWRYFRDKKLAPAT